MDTAQMERVLSRLASEIVEHNRGAEGIVLVGVRRRGIPLAARLAKRIADLEGRVPRQATIDVEFYRDDLSKVAPTPVVSASSLEGDFGDATLVIVDDVLYTGRTVWAAVQYLLEFHPARRLELAVLVDRGHRELPVHADYVGCAIPTRSNEVVKVMLDEYDDIEQVLIVEVEAESEAAS